MKIAVVRSFDFPSENSARVPIPQSILINNLITEARFGRTMKTPENRSVNFQTAGPEDAKALSALSWEIWQKYYRPDILTEAELNHFWHRAYSDSSLENHMALGARYEWICINDQKVGFIACQVETSLNRLNLSKLYVHPDFHGQGIGARALARVRQFAQSQGLTEVYLYVFRNNQKAVHAYSRAGFVIERTEMTETAAGFRYDDYVMVLRLSPARPIWQAT